MTKRWRTRVLKRRTTASLAPCARSRIITITSTKINSTNNTLTMVPLTRKSLSALMILFIFLSREEEEEEDIAAKAIVPDPYHSINNSQYHPRGPIIPAPVELPASADPGNSPLPRYYNHNWSRPFSWRKESVVDSNDNNYRPADRKSSGNHNMI
ncbi:hypothetical protein PG995_000399 [Apiospora arundinis]